MVEDEDRDGEETEVKGDESGDDETEDDDDIEAQGEDMEVEFEAPSHAWFIYGTIRYLSGEDGMHEREIWERTKQSKLKNLYHLFIVSY